MNLIRSYQSANRVAPFQSRAVNNLNLPVPRIGDEQPSAISRNSGNRRSGATLEISFVNKFTVFAHIDTPQALIYSEHRALGERVRVEVDARDIRGGEKTWQHIKKGTPIRAEVGPRDMAADSLFVARRDQGVKDKKGISRADFVAGISDTLDSIQKNLFDRALALRESKTREFTDFNEFATWFTPKNEDKPEIHGGFAIAYWSADPSDAKVINDKLAALKVSPRCIPLNDKAPAGKCLFTGKTTSTRVIFAKNY